MTSDKDDLNVLKDAIEAATPRPDAERRAKNLALAMKNFNAIQGTANLARQNSDRPKKWGRFRGVINMLTSKTAAFGLTATTALVAAGALFLTPVGQDWMRSPFGASRPATEAVSSERDANERRKADAAATPVQGNSEVGMAYEEQAQPRILTRQAEVSDGIVADSPSLMQQDAPAASGGATLRAQRGIVAAPVTDTYMPPQPAAEEFANTDDNRLMITAENPVSTFSIDVDTASYAFVRTFLSQGQLPPADAVRVEEMINYFPYDYPAPEVGDKSPFRPTVSVFDTPWNTGTRLVRIGLQGKLPPIAERPPLNLVFLIDRSGSMNEPAKLPLLIQSFRLMLSRLTPADQVAIVTYAGSAGVALEPTVATNRDAITQALDQLQAGGSTNGTGGLTEAYRLARAMTGDGEVSRVLLATDGDFNVGISDPLEMENFIEKQRKDGTYLSVFGFGRGNIQDDTMQALAQNGNGNAAYIDTLHEAQRVLVDELAGALFPIADDVKIQVEFNPAVVAEYRLIGYETRALAREDFNNDAVDAGELGAGHSVTALYEITPVDSPARRTDPLRYGEDTPATGAASQADELGFLRLRWKEPGDESSQLSEFPITDTGDDDSEARFAAAIAGFGQLLRGSEYLDDWGYAQAIELAGENRGADEFGYRNEAIKLMRLAESLSAN